MKEAAGFFLDKPLHTGIAPAVMEEQGLGCQRCEEDDGEDAQMVQASFFLRIGKIDETEARENRVIRKICAVCWFPYSVLTIKL